MLARDLKYFVTLARTRHYARAADQLGISQPGLSKGIRRLEEEVGTALVETSRRGMSLTPAGELFATRARTILGDLDAALVEASLVQAQAGGTLRVGAGPILVEDALPQATAKLMGAYPGMRLSVMSDVNTRLIELLQEGALDIVFCATFAAAQHPDLLFEDLGEDELSVILRDGHPLTKRNTVRMEDLVDQEWIMQQPDYLTLKWLNRKFERAGLPPIRVRVETVVYNFVEKLLCTTDLLTFLPNQRIAPPLVSLPVDGLEWVRKFGAVYRRDAVLPQSARLLITAVGQETRPHIGGDEGNSKGERAGVISSGVSKRPQYPSA